MEPAGGPECVLSYIVEKTIKRTQSLLPEIYCLEHMKSLPEALSRIYAASGKKFVIIIDEWDVLIRDDGSEPEDSGGLY